MKQHIVDCYCTEIFWNGMSISFYVIYLLKFEYNEEVCLLYLVFVVGVF